MEKLADVPGMAEPIDYIQEVLLQEGSSFNGVTFLFAIRLSPHSSVTFLLVLLIVLVIPPTVVASTATS